MMVILLNWSSNRTIREMPSQGSMLLLVLDFELAVKVFFFVAIGEEERRRIKARRRLWQRHAGPDQTRFRRSDALRRCQTDWPRNGRTVQHVQSAHRHRHGSASSVRIFAQSKA